ncbi:MAG: nicotinate (nicotinamide) nucleotide adenylyltransferase [Mogibacterium sp.]|nr:nicotinate (nicotinamide) nucleotide adenylyltransferase [Mogibacterium sp.]
MEREYAIYGGTFDPVHNGHIALAKAAVRECGLDRLIFMPDYISPFKQDSKAASAEDRYAMLRGILHYDEAFALSSYEILREGPSYTIETLEFWENIIEGRLSFVLGFDSLLEVDTWKRGGDILRGFPLITARRPGSDDDKGIAKIEMFRSEYGADIRLLSMEPIEASSSEIRKRIKEGRSISDMLMPETEEYIIEHGLYR